MIKALLFLLTAGIFVMTFSCSDPTSGTIDNLPPDSYLSIFPDSIIAPGSTLKKINWWGDDPDGIVQGFRISFDSVNWGYTTKNDSSFLLSINGNDSTFRFWVAAVDDKGFIDPTPATNLYPVINTPPVVSFDVGFELPETTYTVATVKFTGSDPDGVETIRYFQYSLGDTNHFRRIPGNLNILTLTLDSGLVVNSNNVLYLRAEDNAGALSPTVMMPDTGSIWYVRAVTSKILMIRDLVPNDLIFANPYFANAFDTIHYDILDIKSNNGALIPKILNPMFVNTLKLYDIVFWTAGNGSVANSANFDLATQTLPFYIQSGGKVFFASGFQGVSSTTPTDISNIAPIDSVTRCAIPITSPNTNMIVSDNSYPVIGTNSSVLGLKGMYVSGNAVPVYKLYTGFGCTDTLLLGIKDVAVNPKVIYFAVPIFSFNRDPVASKDLFRRIFIQEFGYN